MPSPVTLATTWLAAVPQHGLDRERQPEHEDREPPGHQTEPEHPRRRTAKTTTSAAAATVTTTVGSPPSSSAGTSPRQASADAVSSTASSTPGRAGTV